MALKICSLCGKHYLFSLSRYRKHFIKNDICQKCARERDYKLGAALTLIEDYRKNLSGETKND